MSEQKNLFQRINAVRQEVDYIQKDKSVSTGGGSYKAVTHDMVTAVTRQALVKHGVISFPFLVASKMNPKEEGSKQARYDATYDFTFANCDDMTQTLVIRIEAHAMDNADKAPGKALSYAKKYALLKLLDIETGEDEESRVPEDFDGSPYLANMESAKDKESLDAAYAALKEAGLSKVDSSTAKAWASKHTQLAKALPLTPERFAAALNAFESGKVSKPDLLTYNLTDEQRAQVAAL